jgi:hypothetical protein
MKAFEDYDGGLGGESRAKGYSREDLHDAWKR